MKRHKQATWFLQTGARQLLILFASSLLGQPQGQAQIKRHARCSCSVLWPMATLPSYQAWVNSSPCTHCMYLAHQVPPSQVAIGTSINATVSYLASMKTLMQKCSANPNKEHTLQAEACAVRPYRYHSKPKLRMHGHSLPVRYTHATTLHHRINPQVIYAMHPWSSGKQPTMHSLSSSSCTSSRQGRTPLPNSNHKEQSPTSQQQAIKLHLQHFKMHA